LRAPLAPLVVIEYEPVGVPVPIPMTSEVLVEPSAVGVSEVVPSVQVIPLVPHAPAGASVTAELNPLSEVTVTVPLEVPTAPAVSVSGVADSEMLKSAAPPQLANLKDPIAVFQT
jgi:hypothetical protein